MDLISRIKEDEGFSATVYECSEGYLTIGYGLNVDPRGGGGLTEPEAACILSNRVRICVDDVVYFYGLALWDRIGQVRRDALTNMRYQLGPTGFRRFDKMHDAIRLGDWERASNEALDSLWHRQTRNRASRIAQELRSGVSLY